MGSAGMVPLRNRCCRMLLLAFTIALGLVPSATGGEQLGEIKPRPDVDENLFLVCVLEKLYGHVPCDATDPAEYARWEGQLRKLALGHQLHIKQTSTLDQELATSFADFVAVLDRCTELRASIGMDSQAPGQQVGDIACGDAGVLWARTMMDSLSKPEAAPAGESTAALMAWGIVRALDAWAEAAAIDRARRQAIDAKVRHFAGEAEAILVPRLKSIAPWSGNASSAIRDRYIIHNGRSIGRHYRQSTA